MCTNSTLSYCLGLIVITKRLWEWLNCRILINSSSSCQAHSFYSAIFWIRSQQQVLRVASASNVQVPQALRVASLRSIVNSSRSSTSFHCIASSSFLYQELSSGPTIPDLPSTPSSSILLPQDPFDHADHFWCSYRLDANCSMCLVNWVHSQRT